MNDRNTLETEIEQVIKNETDAISLSNKLFSPEGLFSRLSKSEAERRVVVQSPLFKQAQRRLTELQQKEAAAFARAVDQAQAAAPGKGYLVKLERGA